MRAACGKVSRWYDFLFVREVADKSTICARCIQSAEKAENAK
jgi:hypothetical protein